MTLWRFVWKSLWHHRQVHAATALAIIATTAVITGALIVGDSVRGSLRGLTLQRLGKIDVLLLSDRFFRAELANELAQETAFKEQGFESAVGAAIFPFGTVEWRDGDRSSRASSITVLGVDSNFAKFDSTEVFGGEHPAAKIPGKGEIVLNQPLAEDLGVKVGDQVTVRFPRPTEVPADSALGRKSDRISSLPQLKVIAIVPPRGLGRFSLTANQNLPRNAYVSLADLQNALRQEGKVNTVLIAGAKPEAGTSPEQVAALRQTLQPQLADYGLRIARQTLTFGEGEEKTTIYDYFDLTTDRMVLEEEVVEAVRAAWEPFKPQWISTYLANDIALGDGNGIPYSMIAAISPNDRLGPIEGREWIEWLSKENAIVLTDWAAEDLKAKVGDEITVRYYDPETTHGKVVEREAKFVVTGIAPLTEPSSPPRRNRPAVYRNKPTPANDPHYTPYVEGVTDQDTISSWDPPFPIDTQRVRRQDDIFWDRHRTTPKAYISLEAGQKLWGSRFGSMTSVRVAADGVTEAQLDELLRAEIRRRNLDLGLVLQNIKHESLVASSGTTPFDVLFLALSMFIIFSGLLLLMLLFRLGVEQRLTEIGSLLALGFPQEKTRSLLLREGLLVTLLAGIVGAAGGIGYAWLMITGLRTWWVGAVSTPFLELYVGPTPLVVGFLAGSLVSLATIWWSLWRLKSVQVTQVLRGTLESQAGPRAGGGWARIAAIVSFVAAAGIAFAAPTLSAEAQAGAFVGAGMLLLISAIGWFWSALQVRRRSAEKMKVLLSLPRLAFRNAARNPMRSTLSVGLMASASFLIVALGAFRQDPSLRGAGGFEYVAESSDPIFTNLGDEEGQRSIAQGRAEALAGLTAFGFRVQAGDDASCNNLYRSQKPRVLGVTEAFIAHQKEQKEDFAWAGAEKREGVATPWELLLEAPKDGAIPVVVDMNTAMYGLGKFGGVGEVFSYTYPEAGEVKFRVVGLLSNSLLQGSLLISEEAFKKAFPNAAGYRYFLIQPPAGREQEAIHLLEERLSDQGFDATPSRRVLASLLAVQNTYLSTFQSLGSLGLLLGAFGLAAVQVRNVLERRGELGLLQATGFTRGKIAGLILLESVTLLGLGLGVGAASALAAVLPHLLLGGAQFPLASLLGTLGLVMVVGVLATLLAVRKSMQTPILEALRGAE